MSEQHLPDATIERLRVLIAEDHPLFRDGLRMLLATTLDLEVVGEAHTGDEAVALATSDATRPDVIVMDLRLPGLSGIEATRAILSRAPQEDVLRAIRSVGRGDAIFSPTIAGRVLDSFATVHQAVPRELFPMLTEREREILSAMARGCSNAEIAEQLDLTSKTVRNYVSAVLGKLQVVDRAQAIIKAREAGLGR